MFSDRKNPELQVRSRSEEATKSNVMGPLDWLFSDSEPELPLSSPKRVREAQTSKNQLSRASSGTDTETRTLLSSSSSVPVPDSSQGAIPKRRSDVTRGKKRLNRPRPPPTSPQNDSSSSPASLAVAADAGEMEQKLREFLGSRKSRESDKKNVEVEEDNVRRFLENDEIVNLAGLKRTRKRHRRKGNLAGEEVGTALATCSGGGECPSFDFQRRIGSFSYQSRRHHGRRHSLLPGRAWILALLHLWFEK